jgi:hypothetical protein
MYSMSFDWAPKVREGGWDSVARERQRADNDRFANTVNAWARCSTVIEAILERPSNDIVKCFHPSCLSVTVSQVQPKVIEEVMAEWTGRGFRCQLSDDKSTLMIATKEVMDEIDRQRRGSIEHISVCDVNNSYRVYHVEQYGIGRETMTVAQSRALANTILSELKDIELILDLHRSLPSDVHSRLERMHRDVSRISSAMIAMTGIDNAKVNTELSATLRKGRPCPLDAPILL